MLLLTLLLACKQSGSIQLPGGDDPATDDSSPTTDDSDTTTDDSGEPTDDSGEPTDDSGEPTDDSGEPDPGSEPDYSVWIGERVLVYGDCKATLTEKGYALDESFEYWDYLLRACDDCDYWYYVEVSPSEACGLPISTETFRGVRFDRDEADIFYMGTNGSYNTLAEDASFDGWTIRYSYETSGVLLDGVVEYPKK